MNENTSFNTLHTDGSPDPENAYIKITVDSRDGLTGNSVFCGLVTDDPAEALKKLILNGSVYVNGFPVSEGDFYINGGKALWKNSDGSWSWKTHIMFHGTEADYPEAAFAFVQKLSALRGTEYALSVSNGEITKIEFFEIDTAFARTVSVSESCTTLTITAGGDGSLLRQDPSKAEFPNALVEPDSEGRMPADQTTVLYWLDPEGWHLKRADSEIITVLNGECSIPGPLINREYIEACNRPTQPVMALKWTDTPEAEMVVWYYTEGLVAAVTHVDGRKDLPGLIKKSEELLAATPVYRDSSEAKPGEPWITEEYRDVFTSVLESAKSVYAQEDLLNSDYDSAFYALAQAYGGDGSMYARQGNVYEDGVGFKPMSEKLAGI